MTSAVICLLWFGIGFADAAAPSVEGIDYANPSAYLSIPESLGDTEQIVEQAKELKRETDRATLARILGWMDEQLTYDGEKAYTWRNYDDVLAQKCYGGCADQGIVCGVLLKGAGIPTVWVKTKDVAWIWDFKKGRPFTAWSGHVFLEVFLDGKWVLVDPGGKQIYADYDPKARVLPGNRFAYHKGNDPKRMVMSLQWEEWKEQTTAYFKELDPGLLPVDTASASSLVPEAYIVGNSPFYQALGELARKRGWANKRSFNTDYDRLLPLAKGSILLIETHGGKPIVEREILERHFPGAYQAASSASGAAEIDGTTILFYDFQKPLEQFDDLNESR